MKTKIVYVLTSDNEDYYLEQALVSVTSARMHNPDANIILVTDKCTLQSCENNNLRSGFLQEFNEIIEVECSEYSTKAKRSRHIKTSLRNLIDGDYLFIDGDTVICGPLDEIDRVETDFAAVLDVHTLLSEKTSKEIEDLKERIHSKMSMDEYFNSGVLYVKDNQATHKLYRLWHDDWRESSTHGDYRDQPALYRALCKHRDKINFEKLTGEWNCQLSQNGVFYMKNAKIFHFFTTSGTHYHKFCQLNTFKQIKQNGCINYEIQRLIENPYLGLSKRLILIDTDLYTPLFLINELLIKTDNKLVGFFIKVLRKLLY